MNRIESCNFEAGAVQVGEVIHPLQQCLSDNGEKIAAAVTEAQFREVLAVNTELRGEAEKLKQDCRNYLHEVESLKARIVWLECEAQAQQSAPAGYVMVPVEPTPEMLDCIMDWQKIGNVTAYRAMLAAALKVEQPPVQEPVATVTIQHFRQDPRMENVDFQLQVTLPQGTHKLYAAPKPVSDDVALLKEALKALENVGLIDTYIDFDGVYATKQRLAAAIDKAQEKPHD